MNPAIAALSFVPWKDVIKMAPQLVESARKLYESAKSRRKQDNMPDVDTLTLDILADKIDITSISLEEARQYATDQAEITAQLAGHVEALSRGLEDLNSRQAFWKWLSAGAVFLATVSIALVVFEWASPT